MPGATRSIFAALAFAALSVALLTAPACGDDETSRPAPATLESAYCAPLAQLVCGRAVACGCGAAFRVGLDEASCIESFTKNCLEAYAPVAQAIDAGEAELYPERAAECVQLFAATTPECQAPHYSVIPGLVLSTCPAWYASEVAVGEACEFPICARGRGYCADGSCVGFVGEGAECWVDVCEPGLHCRGTCTRPGPLGASCYGDQYCEPPLQCVDGSCGELDPQGSSCYLTSVYCAQGLECSEASTCEPPTTSPCTDDSECGNFAYCAVPRACYEPRGAGAPCSQDAHCLPGHACASDSSRCVPLPGEGETCADLYHCGPGLGCNEPGGVCVPPPGEGEPCAYRDFDPVLCAEGLGCVVDTDTFVCGAMPVEGEPCTWDFRCAAGLACDYSVQQGGICIVPRAAGESCEYNEACAPDHHCGPDGQCTPDVATGEPCKYGWCREGDTCADSGFQRFRCRPLPGAGAPCSYECAEGLVCVDYAEDASCVPSICRML